MKRNNVTSPDDIVHQQYDYKQSSECMFGATLCCYHGFDCGNFSCCWKGEVENCCVNHKFCCDTLEEGLGCHCCDTERKDVDCVTSWLCCRLSWFCTTRRCCTLCCMADLRCLCCTHGCAVPCTGPVNDCVCAMYGIACAPECGCCKPPPRDYALGANWHSP